MFSSAHCELAGYVHLDSQLTTSSAVERKGIQEGYMFGKLASFSQAVCRGCSQGPICLCHTSVPSFKDLSEQTARKMPLCALTLTSFNFLPFLQLIFSL